MRRVPMRLPVEPDEICSMTARQLVEHFRTGDLSPVLALNAVLAQAEKVNPHIAAFYWRNDEPALKAAAAAEARWRRGEPLSELDGLPISVKDNLAVAGAPTYLGSATNLFAAPPTASDALVTALGARGAIVFAKTTMVETGYFQASISALYGPVRNPWNLAMTTGGSTSGGAGAAAAFAGPVHVGTDGGGSLRTPASSCGCVALKATAHRLPFGVPEGSVPNDKQAKGFITRGVRDQRFLIEALIGKGGRGDGSAPAERRLAYLATPIIDPTVGPLHADIARVVGAAVRRLSQAFHITPLAAPVFEGPVAGPAALGAFASLAEKHRHSPAGLLDRLHPIVRENIELLMHLDRSQIDASLEGQKRWLDEGAVRLEKLFATFDALILPTLYHPSFEAERGWHADSPLIPGMNYAWSCGPSPHFSWVRQGPPSLSLPCGLDANGCPVGLMLVGRPGADEMLLELGESFEEVLDGWERPALERKRSFGARRAFEPAPTETGAAGLASCNAS